MVVVELNNLTKKYHLAKISCILNGTFINNAMFYKSTKRKFILQNKIVGQRVEVGGECICKKYGYKYVCMLDEKNTIEDITILSLANKDSWWW